MSNSTPTVSDGRRPGWFYADNQIIDRFGAELGPTGIAIYMALARHANQAGECWPGIRRIAKLLGVSPNTVMEHIQRLEDLQLISVTREIEDNGRHAPNLYRLLDPPNGGVSTSDTPPRRGVSTSATGCINQRDRVYQPARQGVSASDTEGLPIKDDPIKDDPIKDGGDAPEPAAAAELTSEQQVAIAFLRRACPDFSAPEDIARKHPPQRVADWCTFAECVMSTNKRRSLRSLSGWLVSQIETGASPNLEGDPARRFADYLAFARSGAWPADSPWQPDDDEPEDPEPDCAFAPPVERDPTWEIVRSQLNMYRVLRDTAAIRNGDTLTVFVADQQALEWTVHRLRTIITRTVKSVDPTVAELEFQMRGGAA